MRIIAISLFLAFTSAMPNFIYAQAQQVRVHGYVREATSGEALSYATVQQEGSGIGTHANDQGYYSLVVSPGPICLRASFAGYESVQQCFEVAKDTLITFSLTARVLEEVVVSGTIPLAEQTLLGFQKVPIQTIKELPSFLGEPDVFRALTLIPGVATGRDAFGNIFVRGADRGQNLILLDGAPLYNANHVGGLVGAVNTNALKDIEVYKGGFPARFGGRAASVIDLRTRDGNRKEVEASAYAGLMSSGFSTEGPLWKGKGSFLLVGRSSYLDLILLPQRILYNQGIAEQNLSLTFFDINGKLSYWATDARKFTLNAYTGNDWYLGRSQTSYFNGTTQSEAGVSIHQHTVALQDSWAISPSLFLEHGPTYSHYRNNLSALNFVSSITQYSNQRLRSTSSIQSVGYRAEVLWDANNTHQVRWGAEIQQYWHTPIDLTLTTQFAEDANPQDTTLRSPANAQALQSNLYVEDDISIGERVRANLGLRYSYFAHESGNYDVWEPRVSVRVQVGAHGAIKANYTRMAQYLHLLVDRMDLLEREVWVLAQEDTPPQIADQFSIGWVSEVSPRTQLSVEGYYKQMSNLLYLPSLGDNELIPDWETQLFRDGQGTAYGLEVYGEHKSRVWECSWGYTLAWAVRQFDSLNQGLPFYHDFDRRHNLNLSGSWNIDPERKLTGRFVFQSGNPYTLPVAYVPTSPMIPSYYITEGINNVRLPAYHRLDLSYRKEMKVRDNWESGYWAINVYNVYARQNAQALRWRGNQLYQVSNFSILPTLQIGFTF